ncbi:unnamed protein product [Oikopleura dioica]|uniref:NEDD8-activating enzyme E1 catalytic subunit n=1 Tax=Oikopleura dioica TaxID=34765 RepID=E4X2I1_OIKDI|nr:unnamed protein product [Oikopleura dioica]
MMGTRFEALGRYLSKTSKKAKEGFEASEELLDLLQNDIRVLIVGAGGLGCEILKCMALSGFGNIDIIDMDTIDLSNLNRQFLFRQKDVGRAKAIVAAEFITSRVEEANVTPHYCRIEEKDSEFYRQFQIVILGLDSVQARRWMNAKLFSLLIHDDDGKVLPESIRPIIDGGTEGFRGHCRVICPTMTACLECNLDLFPPQVNFPLCTIASVPRLPEHCIEWSRIIAWDEEKPFEGEPVDGDNPYHIQWLTEKARERADQFKIDASGIDFRKTQGVIKRIIPAVASTNAVIASQCVTEAFKLATYSYDNMDNYSMLNQTEGIYQFVYPAERKEDCVICGQERRIVEVQKEKTLGDLIDKLKHENELSGPALTANIENTEKVLYMEKIEGTHENLSRTLEELSLENQEITVTDKAYAAPVTIQVRFTL